MSRPGEWLLIAVCLLGGALAGQEASTITPARVASAYAITCSSSGEHPDPSNWRLLASNDNGASWTVLDVQKNQTFPRSSRRRVFTLTNSIAFNVYRFEVNNVDQDLEVAEFELIGPVVGVTNETELHLKVSASNEHPLVGPATQAFDGDPSTKWLAFSSPENRTCWIQCQYTLHLETELKNVSECVVVGRRMATRNPLFDKAHQILKELQATERKPVCSLRGYALTSANDYPSRDPRDWRLLGSNDGGQTWQTLDVRRNETFATRFQRRVFMCTNETACAIYRLEVDSVRGPLGGTDGATCFQLAEIEPLCVRAGDKQYSVAILARGDNPPLETAEMAFDADSKTKWLDFSEETNLTKSTWIQWQYFAASSSPVLNLQRLRAAATHPPPSARLALRGVVVSWKPESGILGFLDQSGFQSFKLGLNPGPHHWEPKPGMRIRLAGGIQFGDRFPVVAEPKLEDLGQLPSRSEIHAGQSINQETDFLMGEIEGKVVSISEDADGVSINLAQEPGDAQFAAKVLGVGAARLPFATGSRLRLNGVFEPLFNDHGQRVLGMLWVAGLENAVPTSPRGDIGDRAVTSAQSTRMEPDGAEATSIGRVNSRLERKPGEQFRMGIRGVITYIDLSFDNFFVQDGPDGISVGTQLAAGLAPFMRKEGSYVEVVVEAQTNQAGVVAAVSPAVVLGRGQMPKPLHRTLDYLMTGRDDAKWVQVEGVVIACEEHRITLSVLGGQLMVWVTELDKEVRARLVGCQVRVNGVCSALTNTRNRRLGVRLLVPSSDCIEIVTRPPRDPFSLRFQSVGRLLQSDWRRASQPTILAKTGGVVTHSEPLMLFLQDSADGLRVCLRKEVEVQLGDYVEVVGFTEPDGFSTKLLQAVVRKVGHGTLPKPKRIDLFSNDISDQDCCWGELEATCVGRSVSDSAQILELQDISGQRTFSALFPASGGLVPPIPAGSRVRLRGVLKAETDTLPDFGKIVASCKMYANSPRDLTVLARPPWWNLRRMLWGLAATVSFAFLCLAWVGMLRRQVAQRTRELRSEIDERCRTAATLEAEIAERKRIQAQAETDHQALMDASRRAGMAEVATSVLHNVGNVLNSVNVSASLVLNKSKNSKTANLARVVDLVRKHRNDLAEFITNDPKGRLIPDYLEKLAKLLLAEQQSASTELATLMQKVDHIKEIVALQQGNAKTVAVAEQLNPLDLVEDALRITADDSAKHAIQLVRAFDSKLPAIIVDRHKVLQIIVNLLQNAKQACVESKQQEKCLTVRVTNTGKRVKISVIDNGIGIPPDNLSRIFSQGFTTRKDGHGFGLHSSALAARELGGTLRVCSKGREQGAEFTLELPLQPAV